MVVRWPLLAASSALLLLAVSPGARADSVYVGNYSGANISQYTDLDRDQPGRRQRLCNQRLLKQRLAVRRLPHQRESHPQVGPDGADERGPGGDRGQP